MIPELLPIPLQTLLVYFQANRAEPTTNALATPVAGRWLAYNWTRRMLERRRILLPFPAICERERTVTLLGHSESLVHNCYPEIF